MPFGYIDTQYIDFPATLDEAYVRGLRTRAGLDFPRVLREIDQRLGALNAGLDPFVASLMAPPTTELTTQGLLNGAFEIEERAEYTVARPQLIEGGYETALPIRAYDVSVGFTEDGLEDMSLENIIRNVEAVFTGFRNHYRRKALGRLFSDAEVRVARQSAITSPGFAGSGTGSNVFIQPYPNGEALPGGYTHYFATGGSTYAATLLAAAQRLLRWHAAPFDLVAPQSQLDLIAAINPGNAATGFIAADNLLVRAAPDQPQALIDRDTYLGVLFGYIRVRREALTDFTDPLTYIWKSYGALNPRNPLIWRYDPLKGRAATLRYRSFYPLDQAVVRQDFGIGINDRTNGVLIDNAAAPYTAPTTVTP